jgi:cytochrome c oxidase assembly protein subunit 15
MQPAPQFARAVNRWLLVCLVFIAFMVALGGVTRLTESGLSIVEWKLVSGTLPPLNEADWQAEFDEYKTSPQYLQVNKGFTLDDFKKIFWLEYLHRLWGRIIGFTVVLPLVYFAARGAFSKPLGNRLLVITCLIAAQGTVGWVMVASGLNDQPRVEPIKLAAHLLLAFTVFVTILWTRWQTLGTPRGQVSRPMAIAVRAFLALVLVQIFFGALVAGLRAGLSYTTYPLMDGQLIPTGLHLMNPWWLNHLESVLTVQFQHRMGALAVVVGACWLILAACRTQNAAFKRTAYALGAVVAVQFLLGVATLLTSVQIALASAHQLVALLLVSILVWMMYLAPLPPNPHTHKNPDS